MGRTLMLSGRPGVGKTTVIRAAAERLGQRAGGFYTEEIRGADGRRKGFRLVTLDGQEAVMAHVDLCGEGRPRVSRYGVDVEAIERVGVAALRRAISEGRILMVDEIGKMELLCEPFREVVLQAVRGPSTVVATAMARPTAWVADLQASPQVEVWEVTMGNRDGMPDRVLRWVQERAGSGSRPSD